ncbi:MAG: hypothetical protein A2599_02560 [Candidatus Staskawiczbacteria bacterium RIFOXYD1_FULL_39_28]|uniref:SIMPL domain-containing protein n=1 Tax=Candidatus Staskawiczbacteria bacterium RIFOXYC1_FULL_38_18 TaxID=1802229 RepID=A0A1G2JBS4_9BACT|nr:MAG: hypothetical protein A2401_01710 [Candidatus Staskawiczbacteria bacterium RIFOXYC1_FULL_38_18]OGZ90539.1 MAG: hypothetical protein A2599_02560 [Candidatus Staskawiczbacteria bacterium RIFOXYD1_FULL_39_28]
MEQETIKFLNKSLLLAGILIIGVLIFFTGQLVYQSKYLSIQNQNQVTFSGEGKVIVKPDTALVSFGVKTEAVKSVDAVNQNNQKMNEVIKAVKEAGVEDKDIQTTSYNLYPVYDYTERGTIFKGYSLEQNIQVKIRNLDKVNDVLDKATSRGANTIGQLSFTVDDMEKVKSEARAKAIEQARQKANSLAGQSGLNLGKLISVSEGYSPYPQPLYGMGGASNAMEKSIAPDIQPGQSEINVTVNLTYQVK